MIQISDEQRRRAFSVWLRTGRVPSLRNPDGTELKFNPWHDPEDGRFTFAGSGEYFRSWLAEPGHQLASTTTLAWRGQNRASDADAASRADETTWRIACCLRTNAFA